jgi:hypothetical protein
MRRAHAVLGATDKRPRRLTSRPKNLEDLEDRLEIRKRKRGAKFVAWETAKAGLKTK